MIYPVKKVYITQEWGKNPDNYARFGLKGHNGVDFRLFDKDGNKATKAEVFAPHKGVVIEAGFDASGYGNYLKIQNDKEGSILAHLDSFKVAVGDTVSEGQFIAIANNTGNSTGAHLHWGYYPIPRYRDNGYSGTINQLPLLDSKPPEEENGTDHYKQSLIDAGLITRPEKPYNDDELNQLTKDNKSGVEAGRSTLMGDTEARKYWLKKWNVPTEPVFSNPIAKALFNLAKQLG